MNLALWIVTGLLAVVYLASGVVKLIMPKEKFAALSAYASWADDFSASGFRAIGVIEILGAMGLVLPVVLDIAPVLVPLAASGLMMLMVGAAIIRIRRNELKVMIGDLVYAALFVFVAWGRFGPESFTG